MQGAGSGQSSKYCHIMCSARLLPYLKKYTNACIETTQSCLLRIPFASVLNSEWDEELTQAHKPVQAQTDRKKIQDASNMFSLLYGAITGGEYFSDEASSSSSSSSSSSLLSSSFQSSSSIHLSQSQTAVRPVQSPAAYSMDRTPTDVLANTMVGRYHDMSHGAIASAPISVGGSQHGLNNLAQRPTQSLETQSIKRKNNESNGSCRRRHRSPTP